MSINRIPFSKYLTFTGCLCALLAVLLFPPVSTVNADTGIAPSIYVSADSLFVLNLKANGTYEFFMGEKMAVDRFQMVIELDYSQAKDVVILYTSGYAGSYSVSGGSLKLVKVRKFDYKTNAWLTETGLEEWPFRRGQNGTFSLKITLKDPVFNTYKEFPELFHSVQQNPVDLSHTPVNLTEGWWTCSKQDMAPDGGGISHEFIRFNPNGSYIEFTFWEGRTKYGGENGFENIINYQYITGMYVYNSKTNTIYFSDIKQRNSFYEIDCGIMASREESSLPDTSVRCEMVGNRLFVYIGSNFANRLFEHTDIYPLTGLEVASSVGFIPSASNAPKVYTYTPGNLVDGDITTSWQCKFYPAVKPILTFTFPKSCFIEAIRVFNGFCYFDPVYGDLLHENSRMKDVMIQCDGADIKTFSFSNGIFETIPLNLWVKSSIQIRIDSIYPGSKWPDLAVSEIIFIGSGY